MKGRSLALGLTVLLVLALLGQTGRGWARVKSSLIVGSVRRAMVGVQQTGSAPRQLVRGVEIALSDAARLDPAAIEPLAFHGDLLLLLGRPAAAVPAYERAAAHEPRPEVLLHQGLALWQLGRHDEAVIQMRRAVALAPRLASNVPAAAKAAVQAAPVTPLPER